MTESLRTCANGHIVLANGAAFCPACGAPLGWANREPAADPASLDSVPAPLSPPPAGEADPGSQRNRFWRSWRGFTFVGMAVCVAVAGAATAFVLLKPNTATVRGVFTLTDLDTAQDGCHGTGGYSDIEVGATVILSNENGKILGSTSLAGGSADGSTCTYIFTIYKVPMHEKQYAIEVTHRGKVVNSLADMKASDWTFSLSMGD